MTRFERGIPDARAFPRAAGAREFALPHGTVDYAPAPWPNRAEYFCYVDFGNDGTFSHALADISDYILVSQGFSYESGANGPWPTPAGAGSCTVLLDNSTSVFSPDNAESPLYGLIHPGLRISITMAIGDGLEIAQWQGVLQSILPTVGLPVGVSTAVLSAFGVLSQLNNDATAIPIQKTAATGTIINELLNANGFPAVDRSIAVGNTTLPYFWLKAGTSSREAIRQCLAAELGQLLESRDGKIVFAARDYSFSAPRSVPQAWYGTDLYMWNLRQEDSLPYVFNSAHANVRTLGVSEEKALVTVANVPDGDGGMPPVVPALGSLTLRIEAPSNLAGVSQWTSIDLEANSKSDATGTDVTSAITTEATQLGSQYELIFRNSGASDAYLVVLIAYGIGLVESGSTSLASQDPASIGRYGLREFPYSSQWELIPAETQAKLDYVVNVCKDPRTRLTFDVMAQYDDAHLVECQTRSVGDRIHVAASVAIYGLGIDADFVIDHISRKVADGIDVMTITCTKALTLQLPATSPGYTPNVVTGDVPGQLKTFIVPSGTSIMIGVEAGTHRDGITAAQLKYKSYAKSAGIPAEVDLSDEPVINLFADSRGANCRVTCPIDEVLFFAFRLRRFNAWSLWTDGNRKPIRVRDKAFPEDDLLADTAPPSEWDLICQAGPTPNTVQARATRPANHAKRILFAHAQIWDKTVGTRLDLDSNVAPAATYYDGSGISHSMGPDGVRITRVGGMGFGSAAVGGMVLLCQKNAEWDIHACMEFFIAAFEGNNPATAKWMDLSSRAGTSWPADLRIKIVKPWWDWGGNGYIGGGVSPGNGFVSVDYYQKVNADGTNGDQDTTDFLFPPIDIGSIKLENVGLRVFFHTAYSCSDDDTEAWGPVRLFDPGTVKDGGNPTGCKNLTLLHSGNDPSVTPGMMAFSFNSDEVNGEGIVAVQVCAGPSSAVPFHGPYLAQRTAHPSDVLASGDSLVFTAGASLVPLNVGTHGQYAGKILLGFAPGSDRELFGDYIREHVVDGATGYLKLNHPCCKSKTLSWAIVEPWFDRNVAEGYFDHTFWVPDDMQTWGPPGSLVRTKEVKLLKGTIKAQVYTSGTFGLSVASEVQ